MEYLLDVRFEDTSFNSLIHFVSPFRANSEMDAKRLVDELIEGFKRREIFVLHYTYTRIDNNSELRERQYEYYRFCLSRATAHVQIEQFTLENPDQSKSLWDNLSERLFNGMNSTATIGKKHNIPVRVVEKGTRNPIGGEFFYCSIEHLVPEN